MNDYEGEETAHANHLRSVDISYRFTNIGVDTAVNGRDLQNKGLEYVFRFEAPGKESRAPQ